MRKLVVAEKHVRVEKGMYNNCIAAVRCAAGLTDHFRVEVGQHQGLALNLFSFYNCDGQTNG